MKALKKLALLLAVVMVAALALTACGGESGSSGSDSASDDASGSTATNGQLVMATEAGFAPYEYYGEGNEIVGVDVEDVYKRQASSSARLPPIIRRG